ncbi:hypothetical protein BT93_L3565 [Corymbia citriodora subsp. variegata]|uniref:Peptidase C14 caspase domain-containing protein n=1 Tax=Corymbia citriodora subsp. variegata TaxID=360336 RepID=A0A8T0CH83_CORYI|nr:hypothetical protein BT93_L3565 [Corymbia citriodora subsp. variegata]
MEKGKKRSAVLVGSNYGGTQYELHGCINDVRAMREALVGRFGFEEGQVEVLTDEPGSPVMPTGANIRAALGRMVDRAEPGEVLFFHYSGHGTRIPSPRPVFPFKKGEAIVPCDFNLITDVDFRHLVNRLPKGATLTILSDSCHSGGLIDKEKEQVGPSAAPALRGGSGTSLPSSAAPKHIPFQALLQHLSSLTQITTSDIGTHLLETFGAEASLRFRLPPLEAASFGPLKSDEGILLSGCQANETSADMSPTAAEGGKAYGAFSNAVQTVLKEESERKLSNREVVVRAREVLRKQGFEQHPCLYCSDENADESFLGQHDDEEDGVPC